VFDVEFDPSLEQVVGGDLVAFVGSEADGPVELNQTASAHAGDDGRSLQDEVVGDEPVSGRNVVEAQAELEHAVAAGASSELGAEDGAAIPTGRRELVGELVGVEEGSDRGHGVPPWRGVHYLFLGGAGAA
jgi:hypothetical protein